MEYKESLEDLHKRSLEKIEDYLNTKSHLKAEDHSKITDAKQNWQNSWTEFMDMLMYLETLEI